MPFRLKEPKAPFFRKRKQDYRSANVSILAELNHKGRSTDPRCNDWRNKRRKGI